MFEIKETRIAIDFVKGVSVMRLGKNRWVYERDLKMLIVFTQSGLGYDNKQVENIVFPANTKWERPYNTEPITDNELEVIKVELKEAITALYKTEVNIIFSME